MQYPVLSGGTSFRLLTILPGLEECIATRLFTAEVPVIPGSSLNYDTLSYVWGSQGERRQIMCNEQLIDVTRNLYSALVQLRSERDERIIWIDQICINQEDPDERSRQVAIMGQIYSLAQRVIVWLGPSDGETPKIFDLFHQLLRLRDFEAPEIYNLAQSDRSHQTLGSSHRSRDNDDAGTRIPPPFPPGEASIWKAVERFLDRPWFHRVWTFQEVVLSNSCTVYCGSCRISWSDLSDACQAIRFGGFENYIGARHSRVTLVQNQREILYAGERSALRYMLVLNRDRDATDPRDNVYALRGMLDDVVASSIHVDYSAALGEVYANAAKISIKQDEHLAVLGSVEYRRTEESRLEMPSWVPDWRYRTSTQVDFSLRRHDGSRYFNASNGEKPRSILYPEPRELGLKGFVIAKLTRFSEVKKWLDFGLYQTGQQRFPTERFQVSRWKEMYSSAAIQTSFPVTSLHDSERPDEITASLWGKTNDDTLDRHQAIEMAYRRTVSSDLFPRLNYSRLDEKETKVGFPAYTSWLRAGFPDPIPTDVLYEYDDHVTRVMFNREFFIAEGEETSYMGVVMGVPKVGDQVCILLGGDTPFILRPRENSSEWQFVAEAYVHGIMDGQAMARTTEPGFEYQTFDLT